MLSQNFRSKSFTLIELLVVISIIGLISSIVLVSMKGYGEKARMAKAKQFSSSIQHALGSEAVGIWRFESVGGGITPDESGYGNNGELKGGMDANNLVSANDLYPNTKAMSFNGTSNYIDCGNVADGDYDAMTIEAWIKLSSYTPSGWRTPLHRNSNASVGNSVFFIGLEMGSHQIVSTIGAGSGVGYMAGATSIIAQVDIWYHILNSWDGTTARVYVNGDKKKEYPLSSADFNNKVAVTRIGASGDSAGYLFNGIIDEVRIYNTAMTTTEIQKHFAEGAVRHGIALK